MLVQLLKVLLNLHILFTNDTSVLATCQELTPKKSSKRYVFTADFLSLIISTIKHAVQLYMYLLNLCFIMKSQFCEGVLAGNKR